MALWPECLLSCFYDNIFLCGRAMPITLVAFQNKLPTSELTQMLLEKYNGMEIHKVFLFCFFVFRSFFDKLKAVTSDQ